MADSTNTIAVQVVDVVAPEIAPKIIAIAAACDKAAVSVGTLADAMATLKGSGIGSLSTMLDKLETSTLKAAVAQTTLNARIAATTNTTYQLASAQGEVAASLQATTAASRASQVATLQAAAGNSTATAATKGMVSANISAAAGLGILEGRTLSMNRAAANFITRILGLGPLLQQAFVVIGAVALVAVLVQMGMALKKVTEAAWNAATEIAKAFDGIMNPLRKSTDELAVTNDKLDQTIARLSHKPTTNGVTLALDEARVMADKLDDSLERVQKDLGEVLKKNQINWGMGLLTNQGSTTDIAKEILKQEDTIAKVRQDADDANATARQTGSVTEVQKAEIEGYNTLRAAIKKVADERAAAYNKLHDSAYNESGMSIRAAGDYKNIDAQLTELGKAAHIAQYQLRDLDETQANLVKSATANKLHDQVSAQAVAVKEAAKEWKALEATYVSWQLAQDKSGHKPTARESLAELQALGKGINPLNQDKLNAKELPLENKIVGDDWIKDQNDRLANQVATIGMYDDALKEATMLNTIKQEAEKKGITLTDQQTDAFKEQIAQIVESKNYQKELESVYQSVNDVRDTYTARVHALNDLVKAGELTQEQYNQSIIRTARNYMEASDAVVAFQRKLDDQKRDSANKLGSNQTIAANAELNGLAEQMRKGDATHPGGYTEAQITDALAAKRQQVTEQIRKNEVDQAANKLIFEQTNLYDQLIVKEKALNAAVEAGTMSQQAANAAKLQDWNQQNDQKLKSGTGGSISQGVFADYAKGFTTVADGVKTAFSGAFKTLADGFADTIGRAIVSAKNLGAALKDVARSAVGELVGSLIKLALEYLIINKLQKALHITPPPTVAGPSAKQAAEGVAGMAAITVAGVIMTKMLTQPMWSLAAAMAGVTFGLSAAAGATGIASLSTAEQAAAAPKLALGTNYVPNDMFAQIHQGERVIPAADNAQLIGALQTSGPKGMNVQVHNYGSSSVQTQQIDENTVRLIVRDEAPSLVAKHAPGVIAADIANPNSKTSKSISNSTFATRRR